MHPKIVERHELYVIGLSMTCEENELHTLMPELWREFSRRAHEIQAVVPDSFPLDVSLAHRGTTYTQCVGLPVSSLERVPKGMKGYHLPPARYVFWRHEGPDIEIWKSFEKIQRFAHKQGVELDPLDFKIDETREGTHHLYQRIL
ncbi:MULTISPECIES: GyrI-like domain-containing protein [unclassified Exiguobacterium]|uniref:GyrI-like domain-containing protein n=1 Tax=unclassified Exiguobacterium TaxID=2644629 RepID=UPI001BE5632D|nr:MULTISPECIES: GyrI-like domain-containing protein [unclassified Exiguobacterium]